MGETFVDELWKNTSTSRFFQSDPIQANASYRRLNTLRFNTSIGVVYGINKSFDAFGEVNSGSSSKRRLRNKNRVSEK